MGSGLGELAARGLSKHLTTSERRPSHTNIKVKRTAELDEPIE